MSNRLYVGTRKGLFTWVRAANGWETERVDFLGDPVSIVFEDPRDGSLYAALPLGHFGVKLRVRRGLDSEWEELAAPKYPEGAQVTQPPGAGGEPGQNKPASLSEIWCLEAGGAEQPGWIWAGTIPGGLFLSRDHGANWELVRSLWDREERMHWFGGGKDDPGIHSICVDPRDANHLSLAVSCGGVWVTRDAGASWNCQSEGMRAEYMPPDRQFDPRIQDPHRMVCCPSQPDVFWVQHHNDVFLSENSCEQWREVKDVPPSVFGFAVAVHPQDPRTAWFVQAVKDECRVPVDARLVVTRTRDSGESFELLSEGLPEPPCYDIVFRHAFEVDATGRQLAMGSSTGGLWSSEDGGEHWQLLSAHLPQIYCLRFANA